MTKDTLEILSTDINPVLASNARKRLEDLRSTAEGVLGEHLG